MTNRVDGIRNIATKLIRKVATKLVEGVRKIRTKSVDGIRKMATKLVDGALLILEVLDIVVEQIRRIPLFLVVVASGVGAAALAHVLDGKDISLTVTVGLAVPALVYALHQFGDAKRTNEGLAIVKVSLDEAIDAIRVEIAPAVARLEGEVSTQQIGMFPNFLHEIVKLLETADREILVFCDHPAYAVYSNPVDYARYATVIKEKGSIVRLLCLTPGERRKLHSLQVDRAGGWSECRLDRKLGQFIQSYGQPSDAPESISEATFLRLLAKTDKRAFDETFQAADKHTTKALMPLYFWVVDGERAVFALAPFIAGALEIGFTTKEPGLVAALTGIFGRWPATPPVDAIRTL